MQYAYIFDAGNSGEGLWQDLNDVYEGGRTYEVSVSLGRSPLISYSSFVSLELRDSSNTPIRFTSIPAVLTPNNTFTTFTLSYKVPEGAAYIDQAVRVGMTFSGSGPSPAIDLVALCRPRL
jgi:hypothetical protein